MSNNLDILNDKLIIPLQKKYKIELYVPKVEDGLIEYKLNCKCEEQDRTVLGLMLNLFYGDFVKETKEASGKYNYLTYITYLGGAENEENGGKEIKLGVINLDNESNVNESIISIFNGLKQLGFTPLINDLSNIEYGKVLIHGYEEWYAIKPNVKIYQGNNLIGKVGKDGTWTCKFDKDTVLTLKINSYKKTDVKIKSNVNNEVFLYYGGYLTSKIKYLVSDIDFRKVDDERENDKFIDWSKKQYNMVRLRGIIYFIVFILSIFKFKGPLSKILFWGSLIAMIIHAVRFQTKWKTISGPNYLNMDQVYENQIRLKFIPRLNKVLEDYEVKILDNPTKSGPAKQTYIGHSKDSTLSLDFYNRHTEMKNQNKYKYPMLVKYSYKDLVDETIGEIDLSNNTNIQEAIDLTINALEKNNVINKVM